MRAAAALGASAVVAVAAAGWLALLLAELGLFSPFPPLAAAVAAGIAAFHLLRSGAARDPMEKRPRAADLAAVVIALATLSASLPPSEILLGGWDPGVYVHTAAAIAQKGSLRIDEPDLAALTAEEKDLFTRNWIFVEPFPGMRLLPDGKISPQFYHLYPSLMAVAHAIGGVEASWLLNPLLGVGAILAAYAVASLLLGPWWGVAAAACLALNPGQIWQSKFPTAELLTQLLLLAGAALFLRSTRDEARAGSALAGLLLGAATLARYDTLVFLTVFLLVVTARAASGAGRRQALWLMAGFVPMAVHAWIHQRFVAPFYDPLPTLTGAALAAAALVVLLLLALSRTRVRESLLPRLARREGMLRWGAASAVAGWILFGWLLRPGLGAGRIGAAIAARVQGQPLASRAWDLLSGPEAGNTLYLADLLGPAGFAVAVAGVCRLILTARHSVAIPWLAASSSLLLLFTANVFHDHFLMWVARRFVPVVLPLLAVGVAAAGAALAARAGRKGAVAGAAMVAAVLLLNLPGTIAMARHREWPGLLAWYRGVERAVPGDATIFCDQPGFAAPLRFLSGRKTFEFPRKNPGLWPARLAAMRHRASGGSDVYFLAGEAYPDAQAQGLETRASLPLRSTITLQTRRGVPRGVRERGADFVLYRVVPER